MDKHIVVLGSINVDIMISVKRLPKKGETINASTVTMHCGGRGANQAVQCAQMGLPTTLIGMIGKDHQGDVALESVQSKGVDCTYLVRSNEHVTGCAPIFVDSNGDNMLAYAAGSNKYITKEMIDAAAGRIKTAKVYLTQTEINMDAMIYGLKLARTGNAITILNPAPAISLPDEVFRMVDIITPNETECETYTGLLRKDYSIKEWSEKVARWFIRKGTKGVCITLGAKGSFYSDGNKSYIVDSFPIKAVDTTGAGDSFHGGLAYGLVKGYDMETCLKIGNGCGAATSLSLGVQNAIWPKDKILTFLSVYNVRIQ